MQFSKLNTSRQLFLSNQSRDLYLFFLYINVKLLKSAAIRTGFQSVQLIPVFLDFLLEIWKFIQIISRIGLFFLFAIRTRFSLFSLFRFLGFLKRVRGRNSAGRPNYNHRTLRTFLFLLAFIRLLSIEGFGGYEFTILKVS